MKHNIAEHILTYCISFLGSLWDILNHVTKYNFVHQLLTILLLQRGADTAGTSSTYLIGYQVMPLWHTAARATGMCWQWGRVLAVQEERDEV